MRLLVSAITGLGNGYLSPSENGNVIRRTLFTLFFRSLCPTVQKYAWIDGIAANRWPGDKRDVTFGRREPEPERTKSAKSGGQKFIKLRSGCPERSRSNWKNLVFRLSGIKTRAQGRRIYLVKYRGDAKSGYARSTLVSFWKYFVGHFIGDKTISGRRGPEKPR